MVLQNLSDRVLAAYGGRHAELRYWTEQLGKS